MNLLFDFMVALTSNLPFLEAWKRVRCLRNKHFSNTQPEFIQKAHFENHPHSDSSWVYTVNLMQCKHCTLHFLDDGIEMRKTK